MEKADLVRTIADRYAQLYPQRTRADVPQLAIRTHGPVEFPQQQEALPRSRYTCWKCGRMGHKKINCPKNRPKHCWFCDSNQHVGAECIFRRMNVVDLLNKADPSTRPRYCGKCFNHYATHEEYNCPKAIACRHCAERGPLGFLTTHNCPKDRQPTPPDGDNWDLGSKYGGSN